MRRGRGRGGVGARGEEGLGGISWWWRGIERWLRGDGDVGCHETRNLQPIWSGGAGGGEDSMEFRPQKPGLQEAGTNEKEINQKWNGIGTGFASID